MYNQYLELKQCSTGLGVFTKVEIPANIPIMEITGDIYTEDKLPDPNHPALLQVGPNIFIGPSGSVDDYINHSCDPNCLLHIIGNRAIIYSMYIIPKNNQLTFDYSTSSTDTLDKWKMECICGSYKCRQIISGYHYLNDNLKEEYKSKNMVPLFLLEPLMFQKR